MATSYYAPCMHLVPTRFFRVISQANMPPVDYIPRTAGELRISKYDQIIEFEVDDGWCRAKNLTQGGQEGIFPKLYLGTSRSKMSTFNIVLGEVAEMYSQMDQLIAKSSYLTSEDHRASLEKRQVALRSLGPLSYFRSGDSCEIWEGCLCNFMSALEEEKVKARDYMCCVENIKRIGNMLDRCIPVLEREVPKYYSQVLPTILRNALCMQSKLKGLIDIAVFTFEKHKLKEKLRYSPTTLSGATTEHRTIDRQFTTETLLLESTAPDTSPISALLVSYPTLQALTALVSIAACCLQVRSYSLSPMRHGTLTDPDFYNNLQSTLMQLLTTYTGLVPAMRNRELRGLISVFWISFLFIAGLTLNFVAMGVYFRDEAMAPLLFFFGNVIQAITVLQLAIRIQNFRLHIAHANASAQAADMELQLLG